MAFPCLDEAKRYIEALEKLIEAGVRPKRAMRDLYYLAETHDPRLPEAVKRVGEVYRERRALIRCATEKFEEL